MAKVLPHSRFSSQRNTGFEQKYHLNTHQNSWAGLTSIVTESKAVDNYGKR